VRKLIFIIALLLFGIKSFPQDNCLKKFEFAYLSFNPFIENYLEPGMNHGPKNIKCITEYSHRLRVPHDSLKSMRLNSSIIDTTFFYTSDKYMYDSLGRLIEYKSIDERGVLSFSAVKAYNDNQVLITYTQPDSITIEDYKLNENGLPISMYKNGRLSLLYYYDSFNNISRIMEKSKFGVVWTEYLYNVKNDGVSIKILAGGVLQSILAYNNKSQLFNISMYYDSTTKVFERILNYNLENKVVKDIQFEYSDYGYPYDEDKTYYYSDDGLLKEEFRFDDLSKDIHVIEYNYSSDNLLRCKYIYNLHNEDKLEGILLYEYK